jgi:hypothetical protein
MPRGQGLLVDGPRVVLPELNAMVDVTFSVGP